MSVNENGMTILNGNSKRNPQLDEVITVMGEASAKVFLDKIQNQAQNLKQVITSPLRFYQTDQKLYIKSEGKVCYGILKIGRKNLFHRDLNGVIKEIQPLCVLDFYVHESVQRKGIGKELFEEMLRQEIIRPDKLAYDRPSQKLLGFLKKHYNLINFIPQNNNYVIFSQYFDNRQLNNPPQQQYQQNQQNYQQKQQQISNQQSQQLQQQQQQQQQQQSTPSKVEQLDQMMQQMTIQSQQKYQQYQATKAQTPWATDQKQYQNMYQTTTGMMSAQIQKR